MSSGLSEGRVLRIAGGIYDVDTGETVFEFVYERQLRGIHEDVKLGVQWQSRTGQTRPLLTEE